ncbi:AMP-binding protein [Pseudopelagicola sp. nBUS_20]|uniref:AMP-binding protein n=1 Tax=Pseudopelagicola sp. nBUS_20 TaxID=3395317 RepID=UPI003EBE05F1
MLKDTLGYGMSHVIGDISEPLNEDTIPELLAKTVKAFPEREAVVSHAQDTRWTWAEFARQVDRLAGGLLRLDVGKGDRVGIWSPNRTEWLLTQFATARIGAILVCINPAYRPYELEFALKKVGCKVLITACSFKSSNYINMLETLAPELSLATDGNLHAAKVPALRKIIAIGNEVPPPGMLLFRNILTLGDDVPAAELDATTATLDRNDPINVQYTSGTTGSPKGACLTHRNIVNNAHFVTARMNVTEEDRLCIPVPFYHTFGMVMGVLGCVTKGAAIIIPGEGFDPSETLKVVSSEKCTALYGVPTMFVAELGHPDFDSYDFSALRTGIMAGAPCPVSVMSAVIEKMNMTEVTICYGMTETSPVSFQTEVDAPIERRVSTVGTIHPHVECKVVDEVGNTVKFGERGELLTRGYSVMSGYWGDAKKTTATIIDGWMHTGDLAVIDKEGFCDITGRVKDMIIRGGENIYPREIEEFLYTHPSVTQAQVFGIPDETLGEVVCAWIVPTSDVDIGPDELRDFCKGQIAHFKVPLHIRFKDELPMTVSGKPQKFTMCAEMIKELK